MISLAGHTLLADAFHAPVCGQVEVLARTLIEIGTDGRIVAVLRQQEAGYAAALNAAEAMERLIWLPPDHYLLPGFVDTHVHGRLVDDLLAGGTTTALYFATIHQEATRLLVDLCLEKGQRALVGKVAMDHPENCPESYRDRSAEAAVDGTRALIDYVRGHPANGTGRVLPVITPRFIPACTDAALEGLGRLAAECGCHVQTHCSESDWAHGYVQARHGMSDAASLDRFGLMTRRTVLAHANFLDEDDMARVKARGSGIAHCPLSNAYFADSVFPLRRALDRGLHVGLGTDISGGPSSFLPEAARGAVLVSRILESGADAGRPRGERASGAPARIDFREAFHLATAGGAQARDLPVGRFAPGYAFDAVLVDAAAEQGGIRLFGEEDGETILQKIVYGAARANIVKVWVDGRAVT